MCTNKNKCTAKINDNQQQPQHEKKKKIETRLPANKRTSYKQTYVFIRAEAYDGLNASMCVFLCFTLGSNVVVGFVFFFIFLYIAKKWLLSDTIWF